MPDLATLLPMVALLLAIGALAGVIAGLLGVGGGIVLVPAFFYAFSHLGYGGAQLMQICVATSLATIVVTSPRSVMSMAMGSPISLWGLITAIQRRAAMPAAVMWSSAKQPPTPSISPPSLAASAAL